MKIGTDIVYISRIKKLYDKYGEKFLKRIYTENEIKEIYSRKKNMFQTMAGKYAAKEAVYKIYTKGIKYVDIEVLGKVPKIIIKNSNNKIMVSISHEKDIAIAFAVLEKEE